MKKHTLKPMFLAVGLALAAPAAMAVNLDFSGSNIYMKFLDGDRHMVSTGPDNTPGSGDTASGTDNGQWTEMELRIKATISPQVEAGVRIQSRSPAAYWTDFGFADETTATRSKWMKLRGAYVQLTPGYGWLNTAVIGANDWGSFDPFTVGKVRYIDRDNYNGFYFKGPLMGGGSWEAARVSLPNYLQANYGQGSVCCNSDDTQFNEAVYIAQLKKQIGGAKLALSYQVFNDRELKGTDTNAFDGRDTTTFAKNNVLMLKGEGSPMNGVDLRASYYRSTYSAPLFDQAWINTPKSSINDSAYKLDVDFSALPIPGLTLSAQYFNIGEGYTSVAAARRESDVLLTEGSEAAWYNWGDALWMGGASKDFVQGAATPKQMWRNQPGANGLTDNAFMDFDEAPAESAVGWKGFTVVANYELAATPMSLELTRIDYNNNWQNYSATGPLSNFFALNQDRKTNIAVFKASHVFRVAGGLDTSFKWKRVDSTDKVNKSLATDDIEQTDNGYSFMVGNQLHNDLYASVSWGRYSRDEKVGAASYGTDKDILSLRASYNLTGFQVGALAQWITGSGYPNIANPKMDFEQYRLKAFVQAIF